LLLSPDGGSQALKLYIGEKGKGTNGAASTSFLARNGLAFGSWYYLKAVLPSSVSSSNTGSFGTSSSGALAATKMEDIDTYPTDGSKVVLGNQNFGTFTFDFNLVFSSGSFNAANSDFTVTMIVNNGPSLNSADNVEWTAATTLYPNGVIFVNEDNSSGEIWMVKPDGSELVRVGQTTVGAESTGIFDLSAFLGYESGSILVTNNQGSPSSMTVLINPSATLAGPTPPVPPPTPAPIPAPVPVPVQAPTCGSGTVIFDSATDNLIRQGSPTSSGNTITDITVDLNDGGFETQALLKFASLSLPAGASLDSAELQLYTNNPTSGTISAYRMTQSWSGSSTWNSFGVGGDGVTPGVEALSTPSFTIVSPADEQFVVRDVTADVRAWLSGASNQGWAFISNSAGKFSVSLL
jgi:hypothetical protein